MRVISHHKHARNIAKSERLLSAVGGGLLAGIALKKRSAASIPIGAVAGELLWRAVSGHSYFYEAIGIRTAPKGDGADTTSVPYELGIRVDKSITVDKPRAEIYRFWSDPANLARFMENVESVTPEGPDRTRWVVKAPAGRTVKWTATIHNRIENEMIAWRTLPGADVDHAGSVWFKDAPSGRGTEIKVEFQYNPPGGMAGAAIATLWGKEAGMQVETDLRRLKRMLETGEALTIEGQPKGNASTRHEAPAARAEREIERASRESFPASDAPAYNH